MEVKPLRAHNLQFCPQHPRARNPCTADKPEKVDRSGYFSKSFNWVDFAIVLSSAIDSLLNFSQGQNSGALSSLRTLRILRMVRLVRSWHGMQGVLRTLVYALASLGPLCILIGLFMYIFALLGMQLFGGNFRCGPVCTQW